MHSLVFLHATCRFSTLPHVRIAIVRSVEASAVSISRIASLINGPPLSDQILVKFPYIFTLFTPISDTW